MPTKEGDKILSLQSATPYLVFFLLSLANIIFGGLQIFVYHHFDRPYLGALVIQAFVVPVAYLNYFGRRRAKKRVAMDASDNWLTK